MQIRSNGIQRASVSGVATKQVVLGPGRLLRVQLANVQATVRGLSIRDGSDLNAPTIAVIQVPGNDTRELTFSACWFQTGLLVQALFGTSDAYLEYEIDARAPLKDKLPDGP